MVKAIYEGKIVNHDDDIFWGQVEINTDTGLIEEVHRGTNVSQTPTRTFDKNCYIFPGFIDAHIHAREDPTGEQNHKEDYRTAGNAALNGGVVAVAAMPNLVETLTTKERLNWHRKKIEENKHPVEIINYVGLGPDTEPLEEEIPYKAYLGKSVGNLFFKKREEFQKAIPRYRKKRVSTHVEDYDIVEASKEGKTHADRRPVKCVETGLAYLLPLIEEYEIEAKLCHWSTGKDTLSAIKLHRERMAAKKLGYNTTMEVSPLHLYFDTDMLAEHPEFWPFVQMNPSIQGRDHRMELTEALRTGFIQLLATDHAPHTIEEKFKAFASYRDEMNTETNFETYKKMLLINPNLCKEVSCRDGTSGAPWLDTYSFVTVDLIKTKGFTPQNIASVASYNPGLFINKYLASDHGKGYGKIEQGYMGSLTILNTKRPTTLTKAMLKTKCAWSPFEGKEFPGGLEAIIIKGKDFTGQFLE